ncbi:MAG TPA: calcium-binding protein [Microvirga sp.]|jgi:Ca2+-binding RTX toxin-like protein
MAVFDMRNELGRGFQMSGSAAPTWHFFDASFTGKATFRSDTNNVLFWDVPDLVGINEYNVGVSRLGSATSVVDVQYEFVQRVLLTVKEIYLNVSEAELRTGAWFSQLLQGGDRFEATDYRDVIYSGPGGDEISGYRGNDDLYGEEGADTLYGGNGNDLLVGGLGMDALYGGAGDDTYHIEAGEICWDSGGIDTFVVMESFHVGAPQIGVENLVYAGAGDFVGTGSGGDNKIVGGGGADRLYGGYGDDLFDGGAGADRLEGGFGDDIFIVDNVRNVVIGDYVSHDTVRTTLNRYTLPATVAALEFIGTGNFSARGSKSKDWITAGAGNDRLDGMDGHDRLTGGAGSDIFAFSTKAGRTNNDRIRDFSVLDDSIWLDNAVFKELGSKGSGTAPAKLRKDAFYLGTRARDAEDRIIYNKKTGALLYDADGSGSGAAIQFATLTKSLKLTAADFFVI